MIDVKDLSKSFGNLHVLNGINEHIYKGEKVVTLPVRILEKSNGAARKILHTAVPIGHWP